MHSHTKPPEPMPAGTRLAPTRGREIACVECSGGWDYGGVRFSIRRRRAFELVGHPGEVIHGGKAGLTPANRKTRVFHLRCDPDCAHDRQGSWCPRPESVAKRQMFPGGRYATILGNDTFQFHPQCRDGSLLVEFWAGFPGPALSNVMRNFLPFWTSAGASTRSAVGEL